MLNERRTDPERDYDGQEDENEKPQKDAPPIAIRAAVRSR